MIVPIRKMGDPCLYQKSVAVTEDEFNRPELLELIQNMRDTQQHLGGVGIAAPQIGVNKRVVVIEYPKDNPRYADIGECGLKVIINPELTLLEDGPVSEFNEGCLSVPGLRGLVKRPQGVRYRYYDETGKLYEGEDHSFFARVLQHECDHLDGILYPMRMDDITKLAFIDANLESPST
jgi:peptide deformylase